MWSLLFPIYRSRTFNFSFLLMQLYILPRRSGEKELMSTLICAITC